MCREGGNHNDDYNFCIEKIQEVPPQQCEFYFRVVKDLFSGDGLLTAEKYEHKLKN